MSGWIKIDKDLPDTMRFRRVVRAVRSSNALRGVTDNADQLAITITLGALTRLWAYADSHIGDDNVLAVTLDEIDELVGVQGFAKALPTEWLVIIDADHVQLPDFIEHNGTSAKQRRDNARRQADYRQRHHSRNVTPPSRVTNSGNEARPDQIRTEQIRPEDKKVPAEPLVAPRRARGVNTSEAIEPDPPGLDLDAAARFIAYRETRKPAIRGISMGAFKRQLAGYGDRQAAVVEHSIANGYQGLVEPKLNGVHQPGKSFSTAARSNWVPEEIRNAAK